MSDLESPRTAVRQARNGHGRMALRSLGYEPHDARLRPLGQSPPCLLTSPNAVQVPGSHRFCLARRRLSRHVRFTDSFTPTGRGPQLGRLTTAVRWTSANAGQDHRGVYASDCGVASLTLASGTLRARALRLQVAGTGRPSAGFVASTAGWIGYIRTAGWPG